MWESIPRVSGLRRIPASWPWLVPEAVISEAAEPWKMVAMELRWAATKLTLWMNPSSCSHCCGRSKLAACSPNASKAVGQRSWGGEKAQLLATVGSELMRAVGIQNAHHFTGPDNLDYHSSLQWPPPSFAKPGLLSFFRTQIVASE